MSFIKIQTGSRTTYVHDNAHLTKEEDDAHSALIDMALKVNTIGPLSLHPITGNVVTDEGAKAAVRAAVNSLAGRFYAVPGSTIEVDGVTVELDKESATVKNKEGRIMRVNLAAKPSIENSLLRTFMKKPLVRAMMAITVG